MIYVLSTSARVYIKGRCLDNIVFPLVRSESYGDIIKHGQLPGKKILLIPIISFYAEILSALTNDVSDKTKGLKSKVLKRKYIFSRIQYQTLDPIFNHDVECQISDFKTAVDRIVFFH